MHSRVYSGRKRLLQWMLACEYLCTKKIGFGVMLGELQEMFFHCDVSTLHTFFAFILCAFNYVDTFSLSLSD